MNNLLIYLKLFDFRLRINAFKAKDEGLYTCNLPAKEMNIRIRLKRNSPQDIEGKFEKLQQI